ncbi:MAG TPA: PQQ-dependent sugar dehydrogenase [Candidatus Limnocylindria bacterium]|nr:PQQ-dependent sugar dehydrogenase [Candidatus Limnocylindria bacterium]
MNRATRVRRLAIAALIVVLLVMVVAILTLRPAPGRQLGTPMDIEARGDLILATLAEGQIVRVTVSGDDASIDTLADGLHYPRGLALTDDTVYVVELGELPCENPIPRCKGEQMGAGSVAEGELEILRASAGRVLAYPRMPDGGLGEPTTLVDGLPFVNADHGLNDLDLGPDGMLYLSIGNLDRLAWPDVEPIPPTELPATLGVILRIDPRSGETATYATGLRNVYGLSFDAAGALWGVDNDGPGKGGWRFEELIRLEEGLDYGFPDDGTVGPYERRTGFATWIMPSGAGSSGLLVEGDVIFSGACGSVQRLGLTSSTGDAALVEANHPGCVTAIERLDDGRLLLGTVFGAASFEVVRDADLFGR